MSSDVVLSNIKNRIQLSIGFTETKHSKCKRSVANQKAHQTYYTKAVEAAHSPHRHHPTTPKNINCNKVYIICLLHTYIHTYELATH